ncbi:elongation factor 1-beta [Nanoarchaeota archaeon]
MAEVIITMKIMPVSPEVDLSQLVEKVKSEITKFSGEEQFKIEEQPVAFGLKALQIMFVMDESKGDTESLEKTIDEMEEVNSVEITDVRRAVG